MDEAPSDSGNFIFTIPWAEGTSSVVFKHDGVELGRRTVSPHVPEVTVLSPAAGNNWGTSGQGTITWVASDADDDALTYLVQSSCDDGRTLTTLGSEITDQQLQVDLAGIPGGNSCRIQVLASDGINTSRGSSDSFTIADKPPEVYISNPQTNNALTPGWPVILMAMGTDAEDGALPAGSLVWSSDQDGNVGSGDYLIASSQNMSVGEHTITLTGTDSSGQIATFTTQITITPGYIAPKVKLLIPIWKIIVAGAVLAVLAAALVFLVHFLLGRKKTRTAS
jgi:hypothetical protein